VLSLEAFAAQLQTWPLDLSVGIIDKSARQLYRDEKVTVSYPAETRISVNMADNSPLVVTFNQKDAFDKAGLSVMLLGDKIHYRISKLTYDPPANSFKVETSPVGLGISGFVMSKAMDWFFAPQIPDALKQKVIHPSAQTLQRLVDDAKQFVQTRLAASTQSAGEGLRSLSNLEVSVSIRIPETTVVSVANVKATFNADSVVSFVLQTSGHILTPSLEKLDLIFTDMLVEKPESDALRNFIRVGWIETASIVKGGHTTATIRTLVSKENVQFETRNHSFVMIRNENPKTFQQRVLNEVVPQMIPALTQVVKKIDAAVPAAHVMQSLGL
jgi:hypothetical protein